MAGRFRTLIFDLDGTLADTLDDVMASINHALDSMGHPPISRDQARKAVGPGKEEFFKTVFMHVARPDEDAFIRFFRQHYWNHCLDRTRLFPEMEDILDRQDGASMAVASNKPKKYTERILTGLGVRSRFDTVFGPEDVDHPKPHPEMIVRILHLLGGKPAQAMVIGDTGMDILAGRGAGVRVCCVRWGYGNPKDLEDLLPDFLIDHPHELKEILGNHHA